jgi:hypothetical protein
MSKHNFGADDKKIITRMLCDDPLLGKVLDPRLPALRGLVHKPLLGKTRQKKKFVYVFIPRADSITLSTDVIFIFAVISSNSASGIFLDPESIAKLSEIAGQVLHHFIG